MSRLSNNKDLPNKGIEFLRTNKTRPLKDSVKENIFNIIDHSKFVDIRLNGSSVLDAYSGIGSFGLECLSRGAAFVTFVEKDIDARNDKNNNSRKKPKMGLLPSR